MMASFLARELGMRRVIVPAAPGVLSAYGGVIADVRNDFIRTIYADLDDTIIAHLRNSLNELREQALHWLKVEQGFDGKAFLTVSADMRYRGQSYEIETPLEAFWIESGDTTALANAFHKEHARIYEYADETAALQVINLRLIVIGIPPKPEIAKLEESLERPRPVGETPIYCDGERMTAQVYQRADLKAGQRFDGPAIVTQDDTTTCVLNDYTVTVDTLGNLILNFKA